MEECDLYFDVVVNLMDARYDLNRGARMFDQAAAVGALMQGEETIATHFDPALKAIDEAIERVCKINRYYSGGIE